MKGTKAVNGMQQPVSAALARLGLAPGQIVMEVGYDSDVDDDFRFDVEDFIGSELEDEEYASVADAVLMWWRDGDGDLVDALVDAVTNLVDGGVVVLLTPRAGDPAEVDASVVAESAVTVGLHTAGSAMAGESWTATRLAAPKGGRR